jgi:biopolymer transport protein ExbB
VAQGRWECVDGLDLMKRRFGKFVVLKVLLAAAVLLLLQSAIAAAPAQMESPNSAAPVSQDAPAPSLSLLELFGKAGIFIWPLTACSVITVAVIIERFVALRRSRVLPPGFMRGLREVFQFPDRDREQALVYCEQDDSPLARTIAAGIRRLPRGYLAAEKAIEDAGGNEAMKLRHNLRLLYSLGSVATLLGLIGTIWGMIKAFEVASVQGPGHVQALSEGIYVAMVNTFAGLAIAIVVTIFYYYFAGHIEKLVVEMNEAVNEFGRDAGFDSSPTREAEAAAGL